MSLQEHWKMFGANLSTTIRSSRYEKQNDVGATRRSRPVGISKQEPQKNAVRTYNEDKIAGDHRRSLCTQA
jgi:hypothetical protein